jgi:hypothetical protein
MSKDQRQHRILMVGIAGNLLCQASLLAALVFAGEWRVWRFLADFLTQLDAVIVLGWFAVRWANTLPQRGEA